MKGRQRSMAIRSGINKQGWQKTDFPVACEKCYGENPYVRMLKEDYGQECRICFRPFTVFKWKGDKGIYKRTCVCQACSKQKNICQVCTLDLQFGLPMEVRDRRCGRNGKYLLDENFTNADSVKVKPPPPPGPPPMRHAGSDKQLIYIPQKESDQQQQINKEILPSNEQNAQKELQIEKNDDKEEKKQKQDGQQEKEVENNQK